MGYPSAMPSRVRRRSPLARLTVWLSVVAGGLTGGAGLFLVAQVRVVRYIRDEIDSLDGFSRLLGKATFLWRTQDEKLALALGDVPEEYLFHANRVGIWLAIGGPVLLCVVLPACLNWRVRR